MDLIWRSSPQMHIMNSRGIHTESIVKKREIASLPWNRCLQCEMRFGVFVALDGDQKILPRWCPKIPPNHPKFEDFGIETHGDLGIPRDLRNLHLENVLSDIPNKPSPKSPFLWKSSWVTVSWHLLYHIHGFWCIFWYHHGYSCPCDYNYNHSWILVTSDYEWLSIDIQGCYSYNGYYNGY